MQIVRYKNSSSMMSLLHYLNPLQEFLVMITKIDNDNTKPHPPAFNKFTALTFLTIQRKEVYNKYMTILFTVLPLLSLEGWHLQVEDSSAKFGNY